MGRWSGSVHVISSKWKEVSNVQLGNDVKGGDGRSTIWVINCSGWWGVGVTKISVRVKVSSVTVTVVTWVTWLISKKFTWIKRSWNSSSRMLVQKGVCEGTEVNCTCFFLLKYVYLLFTEPPNRSYWTWRLRTNHWRMRLTRWTKPWTKVTSR